MAQENKRKIDTAITDLKQMLKFYDKSGGDEPAAFFAVSKAFEVAVEYTWKELKQRLIDEGVEEVLTPKDAIRKAAKAGMIDNAEQWLEYIDARNESVHAYYGMTQSSYLKLARAFLKDAQNFFNTGGRNG